VILAILELLERRAYKAFQEPMELTALMETRDLRVRRESRESRAIQETLALKVRKESRELREIQETLVQLEVPALPVRLVLLAPQEPATPVLTSNPKAPHHLRRPPATSG
jgi:hypothetical protein